MSSCKFNEDMCDFVIELMKEGESKAEVACALDISPSTISAWCNSKSSRYHKSFHYAIKRGMQESEAWWLKQGRISLRDKTFSYVGWYMQMKNRFGWRDRQELSGTAPITIILDKTEQKL